MADLVTNLILKTQQFDQNIQNAQRQLDALNRKLFELDKRIATPKMSLNDFSNVLSSSLVSSLTKFAGGLGLAMSAGEAFDKAMRSCQTTSDMLDNNLNAAKDSVDAFFRSLVTGDWSAFNDGIIGAYNNLKNLSMLMDELADKKLSLSYIKADDLKDMEKWEQIAKDTTRSYEERINAAQNMGGVVSHLSKKTQETIDLDAKALSEEYYAKTGLKVTSKDLDYFFKNTNFSGAESAKASDAYKEYIRLQNDVYSKLKLRDSTKNANINSPLRQGYQQDYQDAQKALELYKQQNSFLIIQGMLAEEDDENRKNKLNRLNNQLSLEKDIYSWQKRYDETIRSVRGSNNQTPTSSTSTKSAKDTPIIEPGSIAALNQEIASLRKQFEYAADDGTRQGLSKAINDAELKKKIMQSIADKPIERLSDGLKDIAKKNPLEGMDTSDLDKFRNVETSHLNPFMNLEMPFQEDEGTLDYLTAIGSLMSGISGATDNAAASWMNYFQNILQGTIALLPLLASVFEIKAMEGIAEQSKLPWPLNLIAMAATAAGLVASIANVPKFASGGIVSGSSFVGDNVIARVNSGEMILNTRQQANLFSMLDGGARTNVQGTNVVKWRIEGRDLVGVLANQINKTSKYK